MLYNKEDALRRCDQYHDINRSVYKHLKEVINASYPKGTNLVIEFLKRMIGKPYGARNMCMDDVVDCAELPRIAFWIFFEIDPGSWSDGQYYSRKGKTIGKDLQTLIEAPLLALAFYDTSKAKTSGHVSVRISSTQIIQSGANEHNDKVGISAIDWLERKLIRVRTFLTAAELESITVGEQEDEIMIVELNGDPIGEIGKGDVLVIRGKDVQPPVQPPVPSLKKVQYTGSGASIRTEDDKNSEYLGEAKHNDVFETTADTITAPYTSILYNGEEAWAYNRGGAYFKWV